jgi:CBS domain-containing protein
MHPASPFFHIQISIFHVYYKDLVLLFATIIQISPQDIHHFGEACTMNYFVKDLMVPISEYATIPEGSSLFKAVIALENAKQELAGTIYPHWMVLIMGKNKKVIGKLSQLDILRALSPRDTYTDKIDEMGKFGFSSNFIAKMREEYRMKKSSLEDFYTHPETMNMNVEDFMKTIGDNEFVDENTSLDTAAHIMFVKNRLSLLVTREDRFIGVLRLSDVFSTVLNAMLKVTKAERKK